MNPKYQLQLPPKIVFGEGCRAELAENLPAGPLLFICGKHSADQLRREIFPLLGKEQTPTVVNALPEPPLTEIQRLTGQARDLQAAAVIGWGGGSAIDSAKAVAALAPCPGPVTDYFYGKRTISGKGLFFAALPTTAGTGAEITGNAVLSDPETGIKQSLRGVGMRADLAIIDPELTWDAPASVTARSGFDALTQAIEGFLSRKADSFTSPLSLEAFGKIFHHLKAAVNNDHAARREVAEGTMLGAIAFSSCGLGAVHGIGHPLGSICHLPHGLVCAILLPVVLRSNLAAARERLQKAAEAVGLASAEALIAAIDDLRSELGIPENFSALGLTADKFDFIVGNCRSGSMKCNPKEFSDAEVLELLETLK